MAEFMTDGERSGPGRDKSASEVVLVTGASGFIAAALIARHGERYTVVGLDRAGPPDPPPPAAAIHIDVGSDEAAGAEIGRASGRESVLREGKGEGAARTSRKKKERKKIK